MRFLTALLTDKGGREVNQDYIAFDCTEHGGCWVLADGLGGLQAGEVASQVVVETILKNYQEATDLGWLDTGLNAAQKELHAQQQLNISRKSMRSTIVILTCTNNEAIWGHVGDSRLYHFRNGELHFQTKDHSVCQALVNAGEITQDQIRFHEDRNRLFRVLGTDGQVKATINNQILDIQTGDAFLLCSDGFWEYITETEMSNTLIRANTPDQWLKDMEVILHEKISDNNDNYSAIAVFIK